MATRRLLAVAAALVLAAVGSGCGGGRTDDPGDGDAGLPDDGDAGLPDGGDGAASLLPASARILFTSNRDAPPSDPRRHEVYAADETGGQVTRLTRSAYHHFIFGLDASRRYLVASRAEADTDPPAGLGDEDRRAVWVIDLHTGAETRLTDPAHHAEARTFSPDGEWVVMCMKLSGAGEDQTDIYKVRRDGSGLTRLTSTLTELECDPAWSHDGTRIAFTHLDGLAAEPRFVLRTMAPDGSGVALAYDGGPGIFVGGVFPPGDFDPAWSPDDAWLVFERAVQYTAGDPENFGSGIWHLFRARSDGSTGTGAAEDLSLAGGHADRAEYLPSFSPDGQAILFGSIYEADPLEDSHDDVFRMDASGASPVRLTPNPYSEKYPVWAP